MRPGVGLDYQEVCIGIREVQIFLLKDYVLSGTIMIIELFKKDGVKVVLCLPYFTVLGLLFKQALGWFEVNDTIQ